MAEDAAILRPLLPPSDNAAKDTPTASPLAAEDNADAATGVGGERKRDDLLFDSERFITFTDAVVAIAMTLLILPLMEAASALNEERPEGSPKGTASEFFAENKDNLFALLISFFVINKLWCDHDVLFRYVRRFNRWLLRLNFLWMAGVVFLPVAASLLMVTDADDQISNATYMGTVLGIALVKLVMLIVIRLDKRSWKYDQPPGHLVAVSDAVTIMIMTLALLISQLAPSTGPNALILLVAQGPLMLIVKKLKPEWTY